jgi:hypothetical protein
MRRRPSRTAKKRPQPKTKLGLPDLDQAKAAVLSSLRSSESQRGYQHSINEFIRWYCSEPRLSFNKTVVTRYRILSTRKTLRKADSVATAQHHSRTASVCQTVVLQLKVSRRRTNVQRTHSVSFVFLDCPAGRKSGRHSNVAVMQSTDNRNRNQATRSGHGFRCGRGERCSTI